ncbi:AAA family ATPase [Marinobacterium sp. YM272]|uniref:AAA family ATPase n=1 Tax=Marinobacterium sp. YM272 TaxID=3421654 RepID=UPI003D7FB35E
MYESFFGFNAQPFAIVPDPRFFFQSGQLFEEFERLEYCAKKGDGILLITGEVGTGKTTCLRILLDRLRDEFRLLALDEPGASSEQVVSYLQMQLELPESTAGFQSIADELKRKLAEGTRYLLVIDEAQNLPVPTLEFIRLLGNIENDRGKAVTILLSGQPELSAVLARPDLRQFAQRILAQLHLSPLSVDETARYIRHRLAVVGCQYELISDRQIRIVFDATNGNPRLINKLCDQVLYLMYKQGLKAATDAVIETARGFRTLTGSDPQRRTARPSKRRFVHGGAVLGALGVGFLLAQGLPSIINGESFNPGWAKQSEVVGVSTSPEKALVATDSPTDTSSLLDEQTQLRDSREAAITSDYQHKSEKGRDAESGQLPVQQLYALWGLSVDPEVDICSGSQRYDLSCLSIDNANLTILGAYNRPAIIELTGPDFSGVWLVTAFMDQRVTLVSGSEQIELTESEFEQRWNQKARLLWQKPPGYVSPLRLGMQSFQSIYWLQDALNKLGIVNGRIVTGGYYTESLAEFVQTFQRSSGLVEDGVLGPMTIMAINSRLSDTPVLVN